MTQRKCSQSTKNRRAKKKKNIIKGKDRLITDEKQQAEKTKLPCNKFLDRKKLKKYLKYHFK